MKKTLPRKKLQLRRTTIATLTGPELAMLVGGATGPTDPAGVESYQMTDKLEPCQPPSADPETQPGPGPGQIPATRHIP